MSDASDALRDLAEGCAVHGAGFICRHEWADVYGTGTVADPGALSFDPAGLSGARERLAAAALAVLDELGPDREPPAEDSAEDGA